jgi:hypothetical protein
MVDAESPGDGLHCGRFVRMVHQGIMDRVQPQANQVLHRRHAEKVFETTLQRPLADVQLRRDVGYAQIAIGVAFDKPFKTVQQGHPRRVVRARIGALRFVRQQAADGVEQTRLQPVGIGRRHAGPFLRTRFDRVVHRLDLGAESCAGPGAA